MRTLSKLAVAVGVLMCGTAFAQTTVNVPPGTGPIPGTGAGNGGAVLSVWNSARSITRYLNLQVDDLLPAQLTPSGGLVLNFQDVDLSSFGGATDLQYSILVGDSLGGDARDWQLMQTSSLGQAPAFANGDGLLNSLTNFDNLINATNSTCGSAITCIAATASAANYSGVTDTLGNNLPFGSAGAVGSALAFWSLTGTGEFGDDPVALTRYQSGSTLGRWLLTTAGNLTYTFANSTPPPVPLPAAAWLLLSGLAGMGLVKRRRARLESSAA